MMKSVINAFDCDGDKKLNYNEWRETIKEHSLDFFRIKKYFMPYL